MEGVLDNKELDKELHEFQTYVLREVWDPRGMRCPVKHCTSTRKFDRLRQCLAHWVKEHKEEKTLFRCRKCGLVRARRSRILDHVKIHKVENKDSMIREFVVKNRNFNQDPGESIPPRMGNRQERQRARNIAREEEQKRRRNRETVPQREINEADLRHILPRDEEMTLHVNRDNQVVMKRRYKRKSSKKQ